MNTGNFARSLLGLGILAAIASSCTAIVGSFDGPGGTGGGAETGGAGGSMNTGGMSATHTSSTATSTSTHHTSTSTSTSASTGGGGSTSTATAAGGGGAAPSGACTNADDTAILTDPSFSLFTVLSICLTDPVCIAAQSSLSATCSDCFAAVVTCTQQNCPTQCDKGITADCATCQQAAGCLTTLASCTGSYCVAPTESCLGTCANLATDVEHCGSCTTTCGDGSTAACASGHCTCNGSNCGGGNACCSDPADPNGKCTDPQNDNANCGGCGHQCSAGLTCVNGQCSGGCGAAGASCVQSPDCCSGTCDATQHCTQNTGCAGQTRPCQAPSDCCTGFCEATTRTCQLIPLGGACNAATQQFCQPGSGFTVGSCVDGVCCNSGCNGPCQACLKSLTGVPDGQCQAQNSGSCCTTAADCSDPGKPCEHAACINGTCGVNTDPDGTQCTASSGVTGRCQQGSCYQCLSNADCTGATNVCDQQTHLCVGCTPSTCTTQGYNCGTAPDGCGGTINCGTCTPGDICSGGVCGHSCSDAVQDGAETDTDCGGPECTGCSQGRHCNANSDCLSFNCPASHQCN